MCLGELFAMCESAEWGDKENNGMDGGGGGVGVWGGGGGGQL